MSDAQLSEAINLIKSGEKEAGKNLLIRLVKEEPYNENAWLWLASLVEGEQRAYCLQKALTINPNNEKARQVLEKLKPQSAAAQANRSSQAPAQPRSDPRPAREEIRPSASATGSPEDKYRQANGSLVFKPNGETVLLTQIIPKLVVAILFLFIMSFSEGQFEATVFFTVVGFVVFALAINFFISISGMYHIRLTEDKLNGPMMFGYAFIHSNLAVQDVDLKKTQKNWGFFGYYSFLSVKRSKVNLIGFDKETFQDLYDILAARQVR